MPKLDLTKIFGSKLVVSELDLSTCTIPKNIPVKNPSYVFNTATLNPVLLFLAHHFNDCLYINGESGCGKTSLILQIAARLGWGVEQITLSNKCESTDLIGHSTLKKGELVYEYGALTRAMQNGEILLLNEIDLMSPGDLSILNDVLEGKPLTILENNGEVIKPHKNFRVIATANTNGMGDDTGFYSGARTMNQAFMDRFRYMNMSYQPKIEACALISAFPKLEKDTVIKLVQFAKSVRDTINAGVESGVRQISAPFSTRTLLKIAGVVSLNTSYSIQDIVEMCFSLRLPAPEREFIKRTVNDIFGHSEQELKATQKDDNNQKLA